MTGEGVTPQGQLPTVRIGKRILVPKTALEHLLRGVREPVSGDRDPVAPRPVA